MGELLVVPQPDGSNMVFITVPHGHSSLPSGSYFLPACMGQRAQYKLFGRLDRRKDQRRLVWVPPDMLAAYLVVLGYTDVGGVRKAARGDAVVSLLNREALEALGRGDLWPPDWPPAPPPGVQPPQPQIQNPQIMDEMVAGQPPPPPVSFGPAPLYFSIRIFKTHAKSIFISVQAGASESVPCGVAVHFVTVGPCLWLCVAGGR